MMKRFIMLILTISLATILAACGDDSASEKKEDEQTNTEQQESASVEISDKEKVGKDEVVANINGTEVKGEKYNTIYAQTKTLMNQYGQDVSDTEKVKEQVMNILVEQELLKQDAKKQGIEVTKEEVQSEFDKVKKENEKQFTAVLEQYNLTEAAFKEQLSFELTLQKYVDNEISGTEVTDEEVKSYYDKLKEQSKEIPELKEVEGQIKETLKQQKENQKLTAKVKELKENAEIKQMI